MHANYEIPPQSVWTFHSKTLPTSTSPRTKGHLSSSTNSVTSEQCPVVSSVVNSKRVMMVAAARSSLIEAGLLVDQLLAVVQSLGAKSPYPSAYNSVRTRVCGGEDSYALMGLAVPQNLFSPPGSRSGCIALAKAELARHRRHADPQTIELPAGLDQALSRRGLAHPLRHSVVAMRAAL
jgi:hypothetical protein